MGRRRFDRDGFGVAPDATFTLRLSYGRVGGYVEDGIGDAVPKGTKVAPFTNIGGAFDRAAKMGNKDPFPLPKSWLHAKPGREPRPATPLDLPSDADNHRRQPRLTRRYQSG